MRDIAERAGVSQGLLHHHFEGKVGLWHEVGAHASSEFLAYVSSVVEAEALDANSIPIAIKTYMRYWHEHPDEFRINLWRLLDSPTSERKSRSLAINKR